MTSTRIIGREGTTFTPSGLRLFSVGSSYATGRMFGQRVLFRVCIPTACRYIYVMRLYTGRALETTPPRLCSCYAPVGVPSYTTGRASETAYTRSRYNLVPTGILYILGRCDEDVSCHKIANIASADLPSAAYRGRHVLIMTGECSGDTPDRRIAPAAFTNLLSVSTYRERLSYITAGDMPVRRHFIGFNLTVGHDERDASPAGRDVFCSRPSEAPKANDMRLSKAPIADTRMDNSYLNSTLITSTHLVIYAFHLRTPMNEAQHFSSVLLIGLERIFYSTLIDLFYLSSRPLLNVTFHHFLCTLREAYERALLQRCFELQLAQVSPAEVSRREKHMRRKRRDHYGLEMTIVAESYAGGIAMSTSLLDLPIPLLEFMLLLPSHLCSLLQGSVPSSVDVCESFRDSFAHFDPSAASPFALLLRASEKITLFSHTTTRKRIYKSCEISFLQNENEITDNTESDTSRSNFSSREDYDNLESTWEETEGMREKLDMQ